MLELLCTSSRLTCLLIKTTSFRRTSIYILTKKHETQAALGTDRTIQTKHDDRSGITFLGCRMTIESVTPKMPGTWQPRAHTVTGNVI